MGKSILCMASFWMDDFVVSRWAGLVCWPVELVVLADCSAGLVLTHVLAHIRDTTSHPHDRRASPPFV